MEPVLDHIHLKCQNLEASISYYQRLFGAEIQKRGTVMGMPIVRLKVRHLCLALSPKKDHEVIENDANAPRWGIYQMGFRIDDLVHAIDDLESKGGVFTNKNVEVLPGVKAAFLTAPDGVEIELLQVR